MKTNNFRVREKRDKRVILEEEKTKSSLFLLLMNNRKSIFIGILLLILCLLLVSIGIAFSLFRGSNDYDITYITGSEQIETNKDPNIDDEDVEDELLGEISREDGVVVLVKTVMTPIGEIISYYTDGTAIMINSKGKIYRISTNEKGNYGVSEAGKIDKTAKKVLVTSTTSTLSDGTIITYYSDGTARVDLNDKAIFVRDSNNISLNGENMFDKVNPSGVALSKEITKIDEGIIINKFSDGTTFIKRNGELLLVNKNVVDEIDNSYISRDKNNMYRVISEKTYDDGNNIMHFSNGSAVITDKKGISFYVKSSADLLLKNKKLYEIIPNDKAVSISTKKISNAINIVYFNNGAAIVIYPNNDRRYVEDSDDIIYEGNKIKEEFEYSKLIDVKLTEDGKKAYSFENGKTQVIESNNTSYIVDTDTLKLKPIVDDKPVEEDKPDEEDKEKPDIEEEEEGTNPIPIDPGEGLYITEAVHEYDDPLDVQTTVFVIKNDSTVDKDLRITIEEVNDYDKYETSRLEPKFVKFQSTVGDDYVPASHLTDNIWRDENNIPNYIIYDGILKAKTTVKVAISLYVDYSLLNNSHQNKGFLGTIKVYVNG